MSTEYLAEVIQEERLAELSRCRISTAAAHESGYVPWFAKLLTKRRQARASRARSAASAAGHSLSMME
ncbi:MAG: hypothetical protein AB7N24_03675 [Dehalococcoidia bacterium]